jgi:hypothetical protein
VTNLHRQTLADLVHLRRNSGPGIAITTVVHAPGDPRPTTVISGMTFAAAAIIRPSEKWRYITLVDGLNGFLTS